MSQHGRLNRFTNRALGVTERGQLRESQSWASDTKSLLSRSFSEPLDLVRLLQIGPHGRVIERRRSSSAKPKMGGLECHRVDLAC